MVIIKVILNWLSELLFSIVDIVKNVFSFLLNVIQGLFNFIKMLPKFISYLTDTVGFLPSFLAVFATATVSIAIIYLILGRSTNE